MSGVGGCEGSFAYACGSLYVLVSGFMRVIRVGACFPRIHRELPSRVTGDREVARRCEWISRCFLGLGKARHPRTGRREDTVALSIVGSHGRDSPGMRDGGPGLDPDLQGVRRAGH